MKKPTRKFAVIIDVGCSEWWHFGHKVRKAIVIDAPANSKVANLVIEAGSVGGGNRPVKVVAMAPLVDENRVHRG